MELWKAFQILEISVNSDKKEIKKAYAKKAGQYHPEEHPEEWKRLHDAYTTALSHAKDRDTNVDQKFRSGQSKNLEASLFEKNRDKENSRNAESIEFAQNEAEQPYGELFSRIDELAEKKKKELIDSLILQVREMKDTKKTLKIRTWKKLFESESFLKLQKEEWVVRSVRDLIINQSYYFSSLTFVYETLMQWKEALKEDGKSESAALIQETLDFLKFKWNLTEKNLKRMRKAQKTPVLEVWKNLWHMSLWYRILLIAVISALLVLIDVKRGFIFFAMWLLATFVKFLVLRVLNREKRPVSIKDFRKKVSFEYRFFLFLGIFYAIVMIFGAAKELFPEIYRVEIHSYRDILHAKKSGQLEAEVPDYNTYIFYVINEGMEEERVLVILSEKQSEFEKILDMGSVLEYTGNYKDTYSFEVEADSLYYFYNNDINELLEATEEESSYYFMLGTRLEQDAKQWLDQPVYWVTDFEVGS